jgi:hypothetical protein
MLHDSPIVVGDSRVTYQIVEEEKRGSVFPPNPNTGDYFQLVLGNMNYVEGIYVYTEAEDWMHQEEVEPNPYDLALTIFDRPKAGDVVSKFLASRSFILKADFHNSLARANEYSSTTAIFAINKIDLNENHTQLGLLTFTYGNLVGIFTANIPSKDMLILRGETLYLKAPDVRDSTLKNIDITIVARLATAGLGG